MKKNHVQREVLESITERNINVGNTGLYEYSTKHQTARGVDVRKEMLVGPTYSFFRYSCSNQVSLW